MVAGAARSGDHDRAAKAVSPSRRYVEGDYGHARAHAGQGDLELTLRTDMRLGFEAWGATARRTLPAPGGSTVVEHRGAEQLQLRCSTQTAGGPIADGHPSCSRPPGGLQHDRPWKVAPRLRGLEVGRPDTEDARTAIEDRPEDTGRVRSGQAHPLDRATRRHECVALAVRKEAVVGDRRERAVPSDRLTPLVVAKSSPACSGSHWIARKHGGPRQVRSHPQLRGTRGSAS